MDRGRLRSAAIAGVASAVIWIVIASIGDIGGGAIVLWAIILLIGVSLVTYAISSAIVASKARKAT